MCMPFPILFTAFYYFALFLLAKKVKKHANFRANWNWLHELTFSADLKRKALIWCIQNDFGIFRRLYGIKS